MDDKGRLRVVCLDWKVNSGLRFDVSIDGVPWEWNPIGPGDEAELELGPGHHDVSIATKRYGQVELAVDVPVGGRVDVACTADLNGLIEAEKSRATGVWDGPPALQLFVVNDDAWPTEPPGGAEAKARLADARDEALALDKRPLPRLFYRVVVAHYVWWCLAGLVVFGVLLGVNLFRPRNPSWWRVGVDGAACVAILASMWMQFSQQRAQAPSASEEPLSSEPPSSEPPSSE